MQTIGLPFGTGLLGDHNITSDHTLDSTDNYYSINGSSTAGATTMAVTSTALNGVTLPAPCIIAEVFSGTIGQYEFNWIVGGTSTSNIQLLKPLQYNHSNAIIVTAGQYRNFSINTNNVYLNAFNGSQWGVCFIMASSAININGYLWGQGRGYRGGYGSNNCNCTNPSYSGEGTQGGMVLGGSNSGTGGAGTNGSGADGGNGGGGGGNYGVGGSGQSGQAYTTGGGLQTGISDFSMMFMGGGGGGGRGEKSGGGNGGTGGSGGSIIVLMAPRINIGVSSTGVILNNGQVGYNAGYTTSDGAGGGGGGAGGNTLLLCELLNIASSGTINNTGASGGAPGCCASGYGGNGGDGLLGIVAGKVINNGTISGSMVNLPWQSFLGRVGTNA